MAEFCYANRSNDSIGNQQTNKQKIERKPETDKPVAFRNLISKYC